jgi:hypothetical protein
LSGTPLHVLIHLHSKEFEESFQFYVTIYIGSCANKYSDILVRANLSTLQSRRQYVGALFLIIVVKNKPICSSILDAVNIRIPTKLIRDISISV